MSRSSDNKDVHAVNQRNQASRDIAGDRVVNFHALKFNPNTGLLPTWAVLAGSIVATSIDTRWWAYLRSNAPWITVVGFAVLNLYLVWLSRVQAGAERAARDPRSLRIHTTITRNFLEIPGQPQQRVIFMVPPQQ